MDVPVVFSLIAMILIGFSLRDYLAGGRTWSARAKIWLRLGLIFAAVSAYLWLAP